MQRRNYENLVSHFYLLSISLAPPLPSSPAPTLPRSPAQALHRLPTGFGPDGDLRLVVEKLGDLCARIGRIAKELL